eukprot:9233908-Pyramimonas_sp.AAC.1
MIRTSESMRKPDCILLSPGRPWASAHGLPAPLLTGVAGAARALDTRAAAPAGGADEVSVASHFEMPHLLDMQSVLFHSGLIYPADEL